MEDVHRVQLKRRLIIINN